MKRYVCALIALVITFSGSAYAAEEIMATTENSVVADDNQKVSLTGEELIIISPFIADPREYEIYLPEAQYIYENREYDLESYEVIEAVIEEHTKCSTASPMMQLNKSTGYQGLVKSKQRMTYLDRRIQWRPH